jgi:Asp-tRNA(Asn)/Glu-tRNA(Gln) amidotransferase A subunit family amidase
MAYDLVEPKLPRLAGAQLRMVTRLLETSLGNPLAGTLMKQMGIPSLRDYETGKAPIAPMPLFGPPRNPDPPAPDTEALADSATPTHGEFRFESVADLRAAYREGTTDPVEVAERAIAAIRESEEHEPAMRVFFAHNADDVIAQATASKERWAKGEPMGPLDGIPIAIKDEVDVKGYKTSLGTRFHGDLHGEAARDGTGPARLRAAGGVLLGKANMTEMGIEAIGQQQHHGPARNPYNTDHYTGGSSSGPGAAVAAGMCPISLGADGGGSIRHPASFCGVVGLKATFGRVSEHGVPPVCWSVAHLGPLAGTARDCALGYALVAGRDPDDHQTEHQPTPDLERLEETSLEDVTLGIYAEWFDDADPDVVRECRKMVAHLESKGAHVKEIEVPDLDVLRIAHLVTIGTEMLTAVEPYLPERRAEFSWDCRLKFANLRHVTAVDYIQAQRVRHIMCRRFERILDEVDVIVTPTTGCTAPVIQKDGLDGENDLSLLCYRPSVAPTRSRSCCAWRSRGRTAWSGGSRSSGAACSAHPEAPTVPLRGE